MGVKNGGIARAQTFGQLALNFEDLLAGVDEGLFESLELGGDVFLGDFRALDRVAMRLAEYKDFPPTDSRRYRDATENPFSRSHCLWHGR